MHTYTVYMAHVYKIPSVTDLLRIVTSKEFNRIQSITFR